jgi:AraC-like DNA-binding protein
MSTKYRVNQWQTVEKQLLWAYQGEVSPQFRDTRVPGYHYTLWILKSGEVTVNALSGNVHASAGDYLFLPPCDHSQHFKDNTNLLSIRFLLNGPAGYPLLDVDQPVLLKGNITTLQKLSHTLAKNINQTFGSPRNHLNESTGTIHDHLQAERHFAAFLDELLMVLSGMGVGLHRLEQMDDRVLECVRRVQKSQLDRRWNESDMAAAVGLSPVHLNRLFQESLGMTSHAWLDGYRLSQAHLLLQSDRQIKEIAFSLGFSSPQHFSTWFKRKTSRTPDEART